MNATTHAVPLFVALGILSPGARGDIVAKGNALELFNAYLENAARSTPSYRTDLRRTAGPSREPPGRLSGSSSLIGPFTYRARTFAELTRSEREELVRDPRFRSFLLAGGERFSLTAEEMLGPQPLRVTLAPP